MAEEKPIVITDLFNCVVSDLTWAPDGKILVASSYEGRIAAVYIGEALGAPCGRAEYDQYMFSVYGEVSEHAVTMTVNNYRVNSARSEPQPLNEQLEVRLPDGKRRIQPVLLSTPNEQAPAPVQRRASAPVALIVQNTDVLAVPGQLPKRPFSTTEFMPEMMKVLSVEGEGGCSEGRCSFTLMKVNEYLLSEGDYALEAVNCEVLRYRSFVRLRRGKRVV